MVFGIIGWFFKKVIGQIDVFRKYKGFKPAHTSAATIISNSKDLMYKSAGLENLKKKLRDQIKSYNNRINELKKMRTPEPGVKKHAREKKHEHKYHRKRRWLLSLTNLITGNMRTFSNEFNKAVGKLKDITFDSQVILYDIEDNLNGFFDSYLDTYKKLRRDKEDTEGVKNRADKINLIKVELMTELRKLWLESKAQKRPGAMSHYAITEEVMSLLRGNIVLLRKIKKNAIESGNLTLMLSRSNDIENIDKYSRTIIKDNALIQKDVKIIFNKLDSWLREVEDNIAILDEITKKHLLKILNKSKRRYTSAVYDIVNQSRRLYMDVKTKHVDMKVEKPEKKILEMPKEVKGRAA